MISWPSRLVGWPLLVLVGCWTWRGESVHLHFHSRLAKPKLGAMRSRAPPDPPICSAWGNETSFPGLDRKPRGMVELSLLESGSRLAENTKFDAGFVAEFASQVRARSMNLSATLKTDRAFVTMATLCPTSNKTDPAEYLKQALMLAGSLRSVNSTKPLIVLIGDEGECDLLHEYNDRILPELNVAFMRVPPGLFKLSSMPTPLYENWKYTYPKMYIWAMEGFQRLVFVDVDVTVLKNMDDLFELPTEQSRLYMALRQGSCRKGVFEKNFVGGASNLLVLAPSMVDFNGLHDYTLQLARTGNGLDDQRIINIYFKLGGIGRMGYFLPETDMLYTECFVNFDCRTEAIRAIHRGGVGRHILETGVIPAWMQNDAVKMEALYHKPLRLCRSEAVQTACKGRCKCPTDL